MSDADEKNVGFSTARDGDVSPGSISSSGGIWARIKSKAALEVEESTYAPPGSRWSNKDLDPVPPHMQTWKTVSSEHLCHLEASR
jgi:hypothetical protein